MRRVSPAILSFLLILYLSLAGAWPPAAAAQTDNDGGADDPVLFSPMPEAGQVSKFSGASSYSFSLEVPSGAGGMSLPLTLRYSSDLAASRHGDGNSDGGWLGIGWELEMGRVELDKGISGDHRLVLNGASQKLKLREEQPQPCSDAQGWKCEEQRLLRFNTAQANFWRIEKTTRKWSRPVCICQPGQCDPRFPAEGFIRDDARIDVWDRDGVRYEFGAGGFEAYPWNQWPANSQAGTSSRGMYVRQKDGWPPVYKEAWFRVWGLERMTDPHGNRIEIGYRSYPSRPLDHNCDYGPLNQRLPEYGWKEIYPRYIRYTTNPAAGDTHPEWEVEFLVSPKQFDTLGDYALAQSGTKLDGVRMWFYPGGGGRILVREYKFEYAVDESQAAKSYRLVRIRQFGRGGAEKPPVELAYETRQIVFNRTAQTRWFLREVRNGYGAKIAFSHRDYALSEGGAVVYQKPVAERLEVLPDPGETSVSLFSYGDGKTFVDEESGAKALIGFGRVEETRGDRLLVSTFHAVQNEEEHPLNGRLGAESLQAAGGARRTLKEYVWAADELPGPGGKPAGHFVRLSEEKERIWGEGGKVFSRKTQYDYDPRRQGGAQYGNLTEIREFDDLEGTVPSRRTVRRYGVNPQAWIVNRLWLEAVFAGGSRDDQWSAMTLRNWQPGPAPQHLSVGDRGLLYAISRVKRDGSGAAVTVDTRYEYDAFGNRIAQTVYNAYGRIDAYANSQPRTTTFAYDPAHHTYLVQTVNPGQHTRSFSYYHINDGDSSGSGLPGQLRLEHDVSNGVSAPAYQYDPFGRKQAVWLAGAGAYDLSRASVHFSYDDNARRVTRRLRDDEGGAVRYQYSYRFFDGLGRLIQGQQPWAAGQVQLVNTLYDPHGQVAQSTVPVVRALAAGVFHPSVWADTSLPATEHLYDVLGRVKSTRLPGGSVRSYAYPGGWKTVVARSENGRREIGQHYDSLGRLVTTVERDVQNNRQHSTQRQYDALDQLVLVAGPALNQTRFVYDELGLLRSEADADRGRTAYFYDPLGNLLEKANAEGQALCLQYDPLSRVVARFEATGLCPASPPLHATRYTYDQGSYGVGRLSQVAGPEQSVDFAYDSRGRKVVETRTLTGAPRAYATRWSYDQLGRERTVTHPDGSALVYSYNGFHGKPQSLKRDGADLVRGAVYHPTGRLQSLSLGNGVVDLFEYGEDQRLQEVKTGTAAIPGSHQQMRYGYDANGNLTRLRDWWQGQQGAYEDQEFSYDFLDRLSEARALPTADPGGRYHLKYTYSPLGNLVTVADELKRSISTYTYDPQRPYILQSVSGPEPGSFVHDKAGRMTRRTLGGTSRSQSWSAEDRLLLVDGIRLRYDEHGALILKATPKRVTYYPGGMMEVTAAALPQAESVNPSTAGQPASARLPMAGETLKTQSYYFFAGRRVATRVVEGKASRLYYLHTDHLRSSVLTTNDAGNTVHQVRYLPYGSERWIAGADQSDLGFTGERLHTDLGGIYQMGVRFYDPAYGRWLSPDSIVPDGQNPQALNRYSYVYNNPLKYVDPSGHGPQEDTPQGGTEASAGSDGKVPTPLPPSPVLQLYVEQQRERRALYNYQTLGRTIRNAVQVPDELTGLKLADRPSHTMQWIIDNTSPEAAAQGLYSAQPPIRAQRGRGGALIYDAYTQPGLLGGRKLDEIPRYEFWAEMAVWWMWDETFRVIENRVYSPFFKGAKNAQWLYNLLVLRKGDPLPPFVMEWIYDGLPDGVKEMESLLKQLQEYNQ